MIHNPRLNRFLSFTFIFSLCLIVIFISLNGTGYSSMRPKSHDAPPHIRPEFVQILTQSNGNLFLLEPYLLMRQISGDLEEFKWRFNLPQEFKWKRNSLTVGVFADQLEKIQIHNFFNKTVITGPKSPFDHSSNSFSHIIYQIASSDHTHLHLHIVVLHKIKHFFWIGSIPESAQFSLTDDSHYGPDGSLNLHYGRTEQIFDPFNLTEINGIWYPDDLRHFLGQIPTSRYLHCPVERMDWLRENNQTMDQNKVKVSEEAIVNFKSFMRKLEMEFWIACGTLLGWHRQCHITPYTTDTDFATWSRYLKGRDLTSVWKTEALHHNLQLYLKFGEPTHTQEFSFYSKPGNEKVDLFFIYRNGTHFLLPFHAPPQYSYSFYPEFTLCSGELLGYKLLVPCDPEAIVVAEYGKNYAQPVKEYNYLSSPRNVLPLIPYLFNGSQEVWI